MVNVWLAFPSNCDFSLPSIAAKLRPSNLFDKTSCWVVCPICKADIQFCPSWNLFPTWKRNYAADSASWCLKKAFRKGPLGQSRDGNFFCYGHPPELLTMPRLWSLSIGWSRKLEPLLFSVSQVRPQHGCLTLTHNTVPCID